MSQKTFFNIMPLTAATSYSEPLLVEPLQKIIDGYHFVLKIS